MRRFRRLGLLERGALIGLAVITLVAIFGPLVAPHSVNLPSGKPLAAPTLNICSAPTTSAATCSLASSPACA